MKHLILAVVCFLIATPVWSSRLYKKNTKSRTQNTIKKQMLAPGYYHMECQTKEDCMKKNPKSFCHMFMCVDCLKENVACTQNGQCCDSTECIYGRCKRGPAQGPGTFCDKKEDCTSPDNCCVREPAINPAVSICKPQLDEDHVCGPINQYRTVYIGAHVQTACGPCKESKSLECRQVGIFGNYHVCMKPLSK
ncbi:dickkopf-related protein 3-like [Xenia sp. Carnegie-2017]|uniref:dickkopf-related protein 3-like n=1 Tax=Xenia sp. Carnegie-2017 TaxID=2897299 RepID=UPI001F0391EE|nr:dickkopf-related protein 3-like [Xenia sp. Carnegie-2017]